MTQDVQTDDAIATTDDAQHDTAKISDGTSKKDQEWKDAHQFECPCWMCEHVTKPWVESLGQAQQEIERLEDEIKSLTAAYERKPGSGQRGQS